MEAIALVPTIESLLAQKDGSRKQEGINLLAQNVGYIGGLLSGVLPFLVPEDFPEKTEFLHLLASMVYFYNHKYTECVHHAILSKNEWFKAAQKHDPSLALYFQESRNRLIRKYIETSKTSPDSVLFSFVEALVGEEEGAFSLLGLFVETQDTEGLKKYLQSHPQTLSEENELKFVVDGVKRGRFYKRFLVMVKEIWEEKKEETYSRLFFKSLCDSYLAEIRPLEPRTKKECAKNILALLEYLSANRKEVALFLAFILHDISPVFSQSIASEAADAQIHSLLKGKFQAETYQRFLTQMNKTNFALLSDLAKSQSSKLSMNHMAISFCNGLMSCKTTNDSYLRKNLEWMRQAKNWSKFVVAASFGMVHTDSEDPFEVLRHYLPMASLRDGEKDEPESGGALFALGLICMNSPEIADSFLSTFLEAELDTSRSHIVHGACLGLGLARLGTGDTDTINTFKTVLYSDTVAVSEAAAYAIGLASAGCFDPALVSDVLTYAKNTEHEKISRSVGVCIALSCIGASSSESSKDVQDLLLQMEKDADPVVRYAACLSLGTAYVGTGDLLVVRRLLSVISTDASEDVKKVAVFSIGLVLSSPTEKPREKESELCSVLEPLAQSHSAYVRSGVALTLGMFLVGTGCKKALDLIEVLMYDTVPYVRQHASIGAGFLLMQHNVKDDLVYRRVVEHMHGMTRRKSEGGAARFGALLGRALIDACGRNGVLSIYGMSGDVSLRSICGAVLFSQYWYWYPLVPFITLCMRPTLLLAVDTDLELVEDFCVEVDGPEAPFQVTSLLPNETKKSHKKFKTLPLAGEKPAEEPKEEPKEEKIEVEEKAHVVKNFSRLTLLQHQRSSIANAPSVIFLKKKQEQ
ncbi:26S proteasome regulatory subunit N2 [Nematocida sp. AWRm77]|nr:26S proteasome regulatory subunit N2 [Nematocida sp. AWRm77]